MEGGVGTVIGVARAGEEAPVRSGPCPELSGPCRTEIVFWVEITEMIFAVGDSVS